MLDQKRVKEWYKKNSDEKTTEEEWAIETVKLGKEEIDKQLIPTKEYKSLKNDLIVTFYAINKDVVYTFDSQLYEKKLVIGLLESGKLKKSDYIER